MKILFVLENYYPKIGGVETLFKSLVDALLTDGHEITVLTNGGKKLDRKDHAAGGKLRLVRLPLYNRYIFTFLAWIPAVFHSVGKDLIHTTSYNAAVPAYIASVLVRKKTIITFHELWGGLWFKLPFIGKVSRRLHYSFEQMISKLKFDKFIAVSNFTKNRLIEVGISEQKIKMIYNGIDYSIFKEVKQLENSRFTVSYFGRLGISKGLDILLESINLLDTPRDFHFKIIIPREPKALLKRILNFVERNQLGEYISFYHDLSDSELKQLIANSDAVVIPSYSEGFCFAAVESMALGIPIISSGKGALKEVVNGKHIHVEDFSPKGFSSALEKAKEGSWQFLPNKRFELDEKVNQYLSLYKELVSQG